MSYAIRARHRDIPSFCAWALERPTPLAYGVVVPYTLTYHEAQRTTWERREDAEKACEWLNRDSKVPTNCGITCEVVEVECDR